MPVTLICAYCGRKFQAYPFDVRRGRKYCSKSCGERAKWLNREYRKRMSEAHKGNNHREDTKKKISLSLKKQWKEERRGKHKRFRYVCENCGKSFYVISSRARRGKVRFCSKRCKYEHQKQPKPHLRKGEYKICPVCGKKFYVPPCESDRVYCSPECYSKVRGEYTKKFWRRLDYARKVIKKLHSRPSKPETEVIQIIKQNGFPFKYVGDGSVVIGTLNPDFIHTEGERMVLEVFGRAFHDPSVSHKEVPWKQQYFGRIAYYAHLGYKCLILWDDELKNKSKVVEKIRGFLNG